MEGQPDRFSPKPPVAFSPTKGSCDGQCPTVSVDPTKRRQSIKGFGGAFTDSVADVFFQLNASLQDEVIEHLWGANGQQLSLARLTIGSTDFSTTVYNYNPTPDDYAQSNFSIEHDLKQIIPLVHKAQAAAAARPAANRQLDFLSSPWSPPGWMKRPYLSLKGKMRNSAKPGMVDDPKIYASYALYTSKYLSAYKQAGINVSMVTIQNEPDSADHMFPVAYPACNFNGTGEGEYLRDYLGPQLRKDHPDVKIFIHDGQKFHDVPILTRVEAILQALGDKAKDYVDGVAFHWYGNNLKNYQFLQALRDAHPELLLMGTEATLEAPARQHLGTSPWKEAQKYGIDIIGDLNAGATGWIEWNVLLDSGGGPTCIGSTTGTDCTPLIGHCDAPILADTKKQTLEIRDSYYFMGHFSRYIPPGSTNIDLSGATDTNTTFVATAVETPAGDVVVVAVNSDDKNSVQFNLELHGQYALIEIPPHSVQTLTVPASVARAMREQLAQRPLMEQIRGQVE